MSKLKFFNAFLLQWFFVRLTKCQEKVVTEFDMYEVSIMPDGSFAPSGTAKYKTFQWYSLQYWVIPCTGWWSDFKYVGGKPKFWKLSSKHSI